MKYFLLIFTLFFSAQNYAQKFQRKYLSAFYSKVSDLKRTQQGNYIIVSDYAHLQAPLYTVNVHCLDSAFNTVWNIEIKDSTTSFFSHAITECANGDLLICGYSVEQANLIKNPWLVRMSNTGQVIWKKSFSFLNDQGEATKVVELNGSNIILTGFTTDHYSSGPPIYNSYFMKLDASGNIILQQENSLSTFNSNLVKLIYNGTNGFLFAGECTDPFLGHFTSGVLDTNGTYITWNSWLTNGFDAHSGVKDATTGRNGSIVTAGFDFESAIHGNALFECDGTGNLISSHVFLVDGSMINEYKVTMTYDSGFAVLGVLNNSLSIVLIKFDQNFNQIFAKKYLFDQVNVYYDVDFIETLDHGFLISGCENNLIKTDSLGITGCETNANVTLWTDSLLQEFVNPNYLIPQFTASIPSMQVESSPFQIDSICSVQLAIENSSLNECMLYPQPANELVHITLASGRHLEKIQLYNSSGNRIKLIDDIHSVDVLEFSVKDLPSGIYWMRIIDSEGLTSCKKLSVIR